MKMGGMKLIRKIINHTNIYKSLFLPISMEKDFNPLKKLLKTKNLVLTERHKDNLNVSEKNGFYIYNYNQNVLVPRGDPIIRMCRGIVLREDGTIVNYPFDRFFNFHEADCDEVDIENADILEKLDGSLISVWYTGTEWEVTTRGSFYPNDNAHNFKETFCELFNEFDKLDKNYCYQFELCSSLNRIVTSYEKEFITLLGARDINTLEEKS